MSHEIYMAAMKFEKTSTLERNTLANYEKEDDLRRNLIDEKIGDQEAESAEENEDANQCLPEVEDEPVTSTVDNPQSELADVAGSSQLPELQNSSSDSISVFPRFGNMLGGTSVSIIGNFTGATAATCKFGNSELSVATIRSSSIIRCITPINFQGGRVPLTLNVDGSIARTNFLFFTPDQVPNDVLRVNRTQWQFGTQAQFEIRWSDSGVDSSEVDIELWSYRETASGLPLFSKLLTLAQGEANDGDYQFGVPNTPDLNDIDVGVIRVVERLEREDERIPVSLWSDVHVVDYLTSGNALRYCLPWLIGEIRNGFGFLDSRQACPCTLQAALIDVGRFSPNPSCNQRSEDDFNCEGKPETEHCVRARFESSDGGGQECCYDANGRLLNIADSNGGGYAHRVHHSSRVPFFSNFLSDIVPFVRCCGSRNDSAECRSFKQRRPSQMCSGYRGPRFTWAAGDPHFRSLDGLLFTFNGLGEFLYTDVDNGMFVAHVRTGLVSPDVAATVVTAVAAKHRDGDTFHLEVISPGDTEIRILTEDDSFGVDFGVNSQWYANGLVVSGETDPETGQPVTLAQFSDGIALRIAEDQGILDVRFLISEELKDLSTQGLLGVWNDNPDDDLTARDGFIHNCTPEEIHIFGISWILPEGEALFYRQPGATPPFSFPEFEPVTIPTNPNVSETDLADVCMGNEFCEFDFLATGNPAVGAATLNIVESFNNDTMEIQEAEVYCPPLDDTVERKVLVSGSRIGDTATYSCIEGYSLIGDVITTCTASPTPDEDPFWSSPPPTCSLNIAPPVSTCPDGWTYLAGECYRIFSDGALSSEGLQLAADYSGRKQVCQYFQGTVAVLEPFISNLALWNQLISPGSGQLLAIGLDDIGTEGDFRWLNGNAPTQTSWAPSEPAIGDNNEDCVFVRAGTQLLWEDLPCETAAQFICQRHASRDSNVCGEVVPGLQPSVGYLLGTNSDSRRCVATLINSKWAVTSATCGWANRAVFGTNSYSENPLPPAVVREFVFFPHPYFEKDTGSNDVALLFLEEPFTFGSSVKPICVDTSQPSGNCALSSWGSLDDVFSQILRTNPFTRTPSSVCATSIDSFAERDSGIKTCMESQDENSFVPCEEDTGAPFHCIESVTGRQTLGAVNARGFCNEDQLPRLEIGAKVITNLFMATTTEGEFFDCSGNGIVFKSQLCNYVVDCPALDDEIGCPPPSAGTLVTIKSPKFGIGPTNFVDRTWLFRAQSTSIDITVTAFTLAPTSGSLIIGSGTDPGNMETVVNTIISPEGPISIVPEYVWIAYSKQSIETAEGFMATVEIG